MSEEFTGCLPRETKVGDGAFRIVGEDPDVPLVPQDEWKDVDLDIAWMTMNQGPQNSCASAMTVGAIMHAREMAGLPRVQLSQASIYRFVNGGRDMGSGIDRNLIQAQEVGCVPVDVIDQYDWRGKDWPANWKDIAKDYRITEAFDAPSYAHCVSGLQKGHIFGVGIAWGGGGHAILGVGYRKRDGAIKIRNSHGAGYGTNGAEWLPKSRFAGITSYGAWIIRCASLHG